MARKKICKLCDAIFDSHRSQCPSCKAWDNGGEKPSANPRQGLIRLSEVKGQGVERIVTGGPWDVCFGGGLVTNSVTLLGGVAGAGKSTLALQLADIIAGATKREVIYVAAEEDGTQIKDRAIRLGVTNMALISLVPMGSDVDLRTAMTEVKPAAVFFDSIAGFSDSPEQSVEICKMLKRMAVELNAPFLVIDHVTKTDDFAGLEALKHTVDTTITLYCTGEGEIREMTVLKNRFGRANVSIHLLMTEKGLIDTGELSEESDDFDDE